MRQRVRADLLAFQRSGERDLVDYALARGTAVAAAPDGTVQWNAELVPARAGGRDRVAAAAPTRAAASRAPVAQAAFVKAGQPVGKSGLRSPAAAGATCSAGWSRRRPAGPWTCGWSVVSRCAATTVEAAHGRRPRGALAAGAVFARVREYHESEVAIRIDDSRMEAFLSLFAGRGSAPNADTVRAAIRMRGVIRGVDDRRVDELVARASRGQSVREVAIARGREPIDQKRAAALLSRQRRDGPLPRPRRRKRSPEPRGRRRPGDRRDRAPYRGGARRLRCVRRARCRRAGPRGSRSRPGPNVERITEPDGRLRFVARKAGEVFYDGSLLDVKDTIVMDEVPAAAVHCAFPPESRSEAASPTGHGSSRAATCGWTA